MTLTIRKRMALSFIFIIFLTVLVLEALIIDIVRRNYYKNLEDSLYSQVRVSCDLYYKYFSDATLEDNVLNNVDSFWKQTDAQVEIIGLDGRVLMDSIGVVTKDRSLPDVEDALKTGRGSWTGKVDYDADGIMAVSAPLKSQDKTVGVLRFITSLREVDSDVGAVTKIFLVIGAAVVLVSVILSLLLSNSIVGPLKEVTGVAEEMASGNYLVHSRKAYNDEIGKLSDTLNIMAKEILYRDRLKNEFISSISHELRTPLTSIKGWAVTLAESGPEDRELFKDGLSIIENESDRLTSMVEELLDFSRFVTGKVAMKEEDVDLAGVVNQVCKQLAPRAERDGVDFRVEFESGLPVIRSDENKLKQVFINILDNAFKFTGNGGSVVLRSALRGDRAVFTVTDDGCGIPQDELPYVREKFYKGHGSKSGNGIGLSICDEIVKLMNGSMDIKSGPDKGTEVTIALPAAKEGIRT